MAGQISPACWRCPFGSVCRARRGTLPRRPAALPSRRASAPEEAKPAVEAYWREITASNSDDWDGKYADPSAGAFAIACCHEDARVVSGDADTYSRIIERWANIGIDQIVLMMQAGHTTHDQVMRSIELIGERVILRFQ